MRGTGHGAREANVDLTSRFAAVCRHVASRGYHLTQTRAEKWLFVEWPDGHNEPLKLWRSTLPENHDTTRSGRCDEDEVANRARLSRYQAGIWTLMITKEEVGKSPSRQVSASGFLLSEPEKIAPHVLLLPRTAKSSRSPRFSIRQSRRYGPNGTCRTRSRRGVVALARRLMWCPCCTQTNLLL